MKSIKTRSICNLRPLHVLFVGLVFVACSPAIGEPSRVSICVIDDFGQLFQFALKNVTRNGVTIGIGGNKEGGVVQYVEGRTGDRLEIEVRLTEFPNLHIPKRGASITTTRQTILLRIDSDIVDRDTAPIILPERIVVPQRFCGSEHLPRWAEIKKPSSNEIDRRITIEGCVIGLGRNSPGAYVVVLYENGQAVAVSQFRAGYGNNAEEITPAFSAL